ncbi:N-acetyltransferase [Halobacteriovorax marinus]|uniref:N-acetyltransferase n=1 Tax=Halobacteriovorax marinus TaxID=97084 RepID=UPI003A93CF1C
MSVQVEEVDVLRNKKDRKRFIDLQWKLYKGDPVWVPQLKLSLNEQFSPKHPFYKTAEIKSWMAVKDGKDVGRIQAIINHKHNEFHDENIGFYGFFESIEDEEVFKSLFQAAEEYIKAQGKSEIRGPANPSTNYTVGTLIDGFRDDPQIMMTYNNPYHQKLTESLGYSKSKDLLAYQLDLNFQMPEVIEKISARAEKSNKITYRKVNMKDWKNETEILWDIYNDAWEKNWGFIPMLREEWEHTCKDMKSILDPNLILICEVAGEPAGFIVALPDINQAFKQVPNGKLLPFGIFKLLNAKKYMTRMRVLTMGVKSKYRKLGLESILYTKTKKLGLDAGYNEVEMSWILEDNLNMNKPLLRMGAKPYKTYRIFSKNL